MMKQLAVFTILAGTLMFTQCSKSTSDDQSVIAKIDGAAITAADMFDRYPEARLAESSDDEIKQAVDDVVKRQVYVKDAIAMGYKDSSSTKAQIQNVEDQRLFQFVYEKEILDSVISDASLQEMYDKSKFEIHARHILVQYRGLPRATATRSKEEALAVCAHIMQQIKEGVSFDELASKFTEDPSGKNTGGDLGWFGWGKMVGPFQDVAFGLKVGEISDVVETQFGMHIIKLEGRRETTVGTFEESKDQLRKMASREKSRELQELAQKFIFDLRTSHDFQIINPNLDAFFKIFNNSTHRVGPLDYVLKNISFDLPFFTLDGNEYGADWIITEVLKLDSQSRPTVNNINDFRQLLDNMVVHYLIIEYGYGKGYDQDPVFKKGVTSVQENIIYNNYVRDQINANLSPTEEELTNYYEEHKDSDYSQKEMVQVQEVYVKSQTKADSIYNAIQNGADIGLMARKFTERSNARDRSGELSPFPPGRYGEMGKIAFTMAVGEISTPIKVGAGYSIIKLTKKIPSGPESYERVKGRVKNDINRVLREKRGTEQYEKLAKKYHVKIDYEAAFAAYRKNNMPGEKAS